MTLFAIILISLLIVFASSGIVKYSGFSGGYSPDKLKNALFDAGWRVYTLERCGWSRQQISDLGGEFKGEIKCASGQCPFDGYPTWYNIKTKDVASGYLPIDKLEKLVF